MREQIEKLLNDEDSEAVELFMSCVVTQYTPTNYSNDVWSVYLTDDGMLMGICKNVIYQLHPDFIDKARQLLRKKKIDTIL